MLVVGAAILDKGELLAARRISPAKLAGRYELPGGKVEEGENLHDALIREIAEELSCLVSVESEPFYTHKVSRGLRSDKFVFFRAQLLGPRPLRSTDHDALVWLPRKAWLTGVDWIEIDQEVILKLKESTPE